jgi:hypothetical protein
VAEALECTCSMFRGPGFASQVENLHAIDVRSSIL